MTLWTNCMARLPASGALLSALLLAASACERPHDHPVDGGAAEGDDEAPTRRIAIPDTVRANLGMTFAKVETRVVDRTLRVPGRFERLPTARREYRAPLSGRIELLVAEYQRVTAGTPLYRIDSSDWRELHERIGSARARAASMVPLREAHRVHEQSLGDKVALWKERLVQLEELRRAGGGSAAQLTEARATLNQTQAELADQMEKDAQLQAEQADVDAQLRALESRHATLVRASHCGDDHPGTEPGEGFAVCAVADGVVELLGVTPGGLLAENDLVLTLVRPDELRFRARGLQADLGQLRDGLPATIAPPQGGSIALDETMSGALALGLAADADERTIDLLVQPAQLARWARAGIAAHLEVTLEGGTPELAIPLSAIARDGAMPVIFRRDPAAPDFAIKLDADLGRSDGRYIQILSGVKEGDEVVLAGNYQLMLATSGSAAKGGHFHPDGTFHEGEH